MNILNNNGYFAAANSRGGFVSFFKDIFRNGEIDYLYIIKGGSGTGKSRLMREIAEAAEKRGDTAEYFYCSSDPLSLDGILLKDCKIGVIDGTAPHTEEPALPGCRDEILNLGVFWDNKILIENRERIADLCRAKSELYGRAYSYLAAAGKMNGIADLLSLPSLKEDKLNAWADRVASRFSKSRAYEEKVRLTAAISYMGEVDTGELYRLADEHFVMCDTAHISPVVFAALRRAFFERGLSCTVSYEPLDTGKINGLYLPDSKTSFTLYGDTDSDVIINTDRFFDRSIYRENRSKIKFLHKCSQSMVDLAVKTMQEIFSLHGEVEKIYISAMDFKAKEKYTQKLIKTIFD